MAALDEKLREGSKTVWNTDFLQIQITEVMTS